MKRAKNALGSWTPAPFGGLRVLAAVFLLGIFITIAPQAGLGQSAPPSSSGRQAESDRLLLIESEDIYSIGPYAYVTRDPAGTMKGEEVAGRHISEQRGERGGQKILGLGSDGTPSWIVFGLQNASTRSDWVLSFGHHSDGRFGMAQEIFLYDALTGRVFADSRPGKAASGSFSGSAALPIKIEPGEQVLLVMKYKPWPGLPNMLPLEIMSEAAYEARISSPVRLDVLLPVFLMGMAGFFGAVIFLKREGTSVAFILFFLVQATSFLYMDHSVFSSFPLAGETKVFLFTLTILLGFVTTKSFLGIDRQNYTENYILFGLTAILIGSGFVSSMILTDAHALRAPILFLPQIGAMFILVALSFAQAQNGKFGGVEYAAAWFSALIGALVTALGLTGLLAPTAVVLNAYWISFVPQALFLAAAVAKKFSMIDAHHLEQKARETKEAASLARLRQSKESADQARLLRVIEREREVMAELRQREALRTEEMRKAKEAADEANRAKSAFLAIISHEIRTPMTGIMGMVRLIKDTELTAGQQEYAQTIQDSGDAMLALLNDILDFEKIESGKMQLEHVDFDLHRLIQGVVTLMSGHAAERGIYLRAEIDPEVPRYVRGDPTRLRQVLLNLTGNGIKFTSEGGVTLHLRRTSAAERAPGEQVQVYIAIQDTGVGISREAQKNLFAPFAQADASISRKFGGTGLGLAICKRLIEAMGGTIGLNSKEGEGSTFFFSLNLEEGKEDAAKDSASSRPRAQTRAPERQLLTLVVDDNDINRKVLKGLVEREGHKVDLAATAGEAVEMCKALRYDVVFMDIELPDMHGDEATKIIRGLPDDATASTPIIALTGNVMDDDVKRFYAANMNGFVPKPVDPESLKKALTQALQGQFTNPVSLLRPAGDQGKPAPAAPALASPAAPIAAPAAVPPVADPEPSGPAASSQAPPSTAPRSSHPPLLKPEALTDTGGLRLEDGADGMEDSFSEAIRHGEEKEASQNAAEGAAGPAGAGRAEIFDVAMLDSLKDNLGRDQLSDLLGSLTDKADEIVAALEAALSPLNIQAIAARAHELKGMAGNFGLTELSRIAGDAERKAKTGQSDGLTEMISRLPAANIRAKEALRDWLNG